MNNNQTSSDDTTEKTTVTTPSDSTSETANDATTTEDDTTEDGPIVDEPVADDGRDYFLEGVITDPVSVSVSFEAIDSSITIDAGNTFTVANSANASISLKNTNITNYDATSVLLYITNSPNTTFTIKEQTAEGDIIIDSASTLNLIVDERSHYMGIINGGNTAQSVSVSIDETSQLVLAGDSYISELKNADPTNMNIYSNGHKLYVSGSEVALNNSEAPEIEKPEAEQEGTEIDYKETTTTDDATTGSTTNLVPYIVGGAAILLIIIAIIIFIIHNKKKNSPSTPADGAGMMPESPNGGRPDFSQFDDGPAQQPNSFTAPEQTPPVTPPSEPTADSNPTQPTPPPSDSHEPYVGQM